MANFRELESDLRIKIFLLNENNTLLKGLTAAI